MTLRDEAELLDERVKVIARKEAERIQAKNVGWDNESLRLGFRLGYAYRKREEAKAQHENSARTGPDNRRGTERKCSIDLNTATKEPHA